MPDRPDIDPRALERVLGRLAGSPEPPWLHEEVARRMAERLPLIRQAPATWLDWWGTSSGSAEAVRATLPAARRLAVELTPALRARRLAALRGPWWALARRRDAQHVVLLEADVPPGSAQMVWANMVLHGSPEPAALLARWHAALEVNGFLMFSALGPDTLRELRALYAECGWPAPHPPFTDMHDIGDALVHAGFADPVMDQETLRLNWSSPEALLKELRLWGGHLGRARFAGLRTPRWRRRLLQALAARADAQGRIHMSFELVYGHAFKGAPRPAPGQPVPVSLDRLRASLPPRRDPDSDR